VVAPPLPNSKWDERRIRPHAASFAPFAPAVPTEWAPIHSHDRWTSSPTSQWTSTLKPAVVPLIDVFETPTCHSHGGRQESN